MRECFDVRFSLARIKAHKNGLFLWGVTFGDPTMTENNKGNGGETGRNADQAKGHHLHLGQSEPSRAMCRTTNRVEGGDGPPFPDSTDNEISGRRRTECRKTTET